MGTMVEAEITPESFALSEALEAVPEAEIEVVSLTANGTGRVAPLLWVTDAETEPVADALRADPTTRAVSLVSRRTRDSLFQVDWVDRVESVIRDFAAESGAVLSARATSAAWTFRMLFVDHDAVSRTVERCRDAGVDVDVTRISNLGTTRPSDDPSLTGPQCATVRAAFEEGYYEVPRETTLEGLADELGVSHQALSERLRRGHRSLVRQALRVS